MEIENKIVRMRDFPNAYFRLTSRCNNNCAHCYVNLPEKAKADELSVESWCRIIDQLVVNNIGYLVFTGGEPTLYPGFKEVYVYAKKKGMAITLMTNATNLDEATKNILYKYPPSWLQTTIYGINEETYFAVTGNKEGWKNFCKNMEFFLKLQKEKGTILEITSILTKDTIKFYEEINALSESYIGRKPVYTNFLFLRIDKNLKKNKIIKSKRLSGEERKRVMEKIENKEISCFSVEDPKIGNIKDSLFSCNIGQGRNIYFFEEGTITFCSLINEEKYVVKLEQKEFENFNYKEVKKELVRKISPLLSLKTNKKCATCNLKEQCFSCPAKNLLEGISIEGYIEELCLR